jgi:hypothetical protein
VFIFTVHKSAVSITVMPFMFVDPESVPLIALGAVSLVPVNSGIQSTEPRTQWKPTLTAFIFIYSQLM